MNKPLATYTLAFSIFCLSGALIYFSWKLVEVKDALPALINQVDKTAVKVSPIIDEIAEIKALVPDVLNEVEQVRVIVPDVLTQVEQVQALVPVIVSEVEAVRQSIPDITNEVAQVRQLMPDVLSRVDDINQQVPTISATVDRFSSQLADTNQQIPKILTEVEATRTSIPEVLSRTEAIVANLGQVGKTTGEEAVYGVFSGLFKAPLKVVGGIGKAITEPFENKAAWVKPQDRKNIEQLIEQLLGQDELESFTQTHDKTKNTSTITLIKRTVINAKPCKVLQVDVKSPRGQQVDHQLTFCLTEKNTWRLHE